MLVTHESDIAEYAKRIVVFKDGRIREDRAVSRPRDAREVRAQLGQTQETLDEELV